jgi:HPt (histidine-containing phosphotransfer) domain-containing protein
LAQFQTNMDGILDSIDAHAAAAPSASLAATCHEGAGAAAVIGATRLHAHLARMEALCHAGNRTAVLADHAGLRALWDATRAALLAQA